mmetsp:Transcript_3525/g.9049  ORF Transcript_3525/g.9049 Transcript_3525/m.9049 type:complete len:84 (+) Transcript_3525:110-361(+)
MSTPRDMDVPVEILTENDKTDVCTAACVTTCGSDGESEAWTLTQSISCLVASGCVVIPPEDFEEAVAAERPAKTSAEIESKKH